MFMVQRKTVFLLCVPAWSTVWRACHEFATADYWHLYSRNGSFTKRITRIFSTRQSRCVGLLCHSCLWSLWTRNIEFIVSKVQRMRMSKYTLQQMFSNFCGLWQFGKAQSQKAGHMFRMFCRYYFNFDEDKLLFLDLRKTQSSFPRSRILRTAACSFPGGK